MIYVSRKSRNSSQGTATTGISPFAGPRIRETNILRQGVHFMASRNICPGWRTPLALLLLITLNAAHAAPPEFFRYKLGLNGASYKTLQEAEQAMLLFNEKSQYLKAKNRELCNYWGWLSESYIYENPNPVMDPVISISYCHDGSSWPCQTSLQEAIDTFKNSNPNNQKVISTRLSNQPG